MQTHLAAARQDMHTDAIPAATSLQTSLSLAAAILSRARASSAIPSATRQQARQWLTLAEQQLPILTADAILRLLSLYTPLHHIAYSVPPSPEFINKWHEHTLLLIAKGQKADKLPIMRWMRSRLADNPRAVPPRLRTWYADVLSRWVKESLARTPLSRHPRAEARAIADFLLQENLHAYTPDPALLKSLSLIHI